MLIELMFGSCVVDFLYLKDAIARVQLAFHIKRTSSPLIQRTFFGFASSSAG